MSKELNVKHVELGSRILLILLLPAFIAWDAFVVVKIWNWYMVPIGAPVIAMIHAIGIDLIVSMLRYNPVSTKADELTIEHSDEKRTPYAIHLIMGKIFFPAFVLFVAWVALSIAGGAA